MGIVSWAVFGTPTGQVPGMPTDDIAVGVADALLGGFLFPLVLGPARSLLGDRCHQGRRVRPLPRRDPGTGGRSVPADGRAVCSIPALT